MIAFFVLLALGFAEVGMAIFWMANLEGEGVVGIFFVFMLTFVAGTITLGVACSRSRPEDRAEADLKSYYSQTPKAVNQTS